MNKNYAQSCDEYRRFVGKLEHYAIVQVDKLKWAWIVRRKRKERKERECAGCGALWVEGQIYCRSCAEMI